MTFHKNIIDIDPAAETNRLVKALRQTVQKDLKRRGGVIGISGGVDSSVVLALTVRAFGPQRVTAITLPEKDSEPESLDLANCVAQHYGITLITENITAALQGFGCYRRRDEAIRRVFPEYDAAAGYKAKIVLPQNLLEEDSLNLFSLTIVTPNGQELNEHLPLKEYLQIVAASNFKQRTRMAMLYYHAELRNYAVIGTANKNEHDQGFFVKFGDGGVDVRPIGHLLKTQIYQLAAYLDVPEVIRQRPPTSDTYSAHQSQEEFFFRIPFNTMDLLWYAQEQNVPITQVAEAMNLTAEQVQRVFHDFSQKRAATAYLRTSPINLA
ncbi:MAG: NAD(+) synthase [Ardenticatenaceae bacterium]|nr:NAD(+) synthase [Ardenticatenaceae bacterium]MCB9443923.1 NAD(+) synthase [Ardenticatenaceae bacterium]